MPIQTDRTTVPLAIIGMGCRLPGAANLDEYWRLIYEGQSAVAEVPAERLNQELYYDPQVGVRGKTYCKLAALLADRQFDAARCPLSEEIVRSADNTHLLMTEVAAEALRHAQLDPFNLPYRNTGVFIGHAQGSSRLGELIFNAYLEDAMDLLVSTASFRSLPANQQEEILQEITGQIQQQHPRVEERARNLSCNMVSGTIARAFGLNGQWLALNSACASSLHAMLIGARALQRGRVDMVIVGGASDCKSDSLVLFSHAQAMSSKATRPFDAAADGLIMSEGYVALVMKTLERALADGDPIQAVVRGLGVATDGRGKSLWAPRKEGQMKAMQRAYRSGVEISKLQYLECHATATQLGDATELDTLGQVLRPDFPNGKRIPITSVKANIGHSLEAAGMAGLIKTVLCIQKQTFPPAINVNSLNPKVDWDAAPFYVPLQPSPWQPQPDGSPRRAAVNAFGIGGLNMHVVVDEYTPTSTLAPAVSRSLPSETAEDRAIAVVGISCIVPGADGVSEFWQLLMSGQDPKMSPPADRWSQRALRRAQQRSISPRGGFIPNYEYDWRKNKVPPKQVAEADPLQFMLLDVSERALDDAGYERASIDREHCGVVVGTEFGGDFSEHLEMGLRLPEMKHVIVQSLRRRGYTAEQIEAISQEFEQDLLAKWPSLVDETGSFTSSTLASRISKTLDLAGGAVSIDSGGTSAMSSLSICIDMLLSGDNDLMICSAGQRRMGSSTYEQMEQDHLLDAQGHPRSILDAHYHGVVPGEGAGAVVLKRLSDARRDGDRIHAIIRGFGAAHHSSPAEALRLAIQRSCEMAGITPPDIGFAELDTDEPLDTAAEPLRSLGTLHGSPDRERSLNVSSSTAQTGHLGGASAMVALIKASMCLENEQLPATFAASEVHPDLSAADQLDVNVRPTGLDGRRYGAVVSWAKGQVWHMILEHPAPVAKQPVLAPSVETAAGTHAAPTMASAATHDAVRIIRLGAPTIERLQAGIEQAQRDVAGTWAAAQDAFRPADRIRLAIVAGSPEQLQRKLKLAQGQAQNPSARQVLQQQGIFCHELPGQRPRVAFVFPGQGSQYDGMLRELVGQVPAAARMLEQIDSSMSHLGFPSFPELAWATPTELGKDVWVTQVSMLLADAIVLAAAGDRGMVPDLVLGHSYGELVALYAAGVWDLETAIVMTKARCDGIVAVASGDAGMLATDAPPEQIKRLIAEAGVQAYLANFNAPDQTTVGGKRVQLESLAATLESQSHQARLLSVPAAFHTPLMAGSSRLLVQALQTANLRVPKIPAVSTVDNSLMQDVEHIRRNLGGQLTTPVQYAPLIKRLAAEAPTIFVEVGPQQTLTRLNQRTLADAADFRSYYIACDNPKRAGLEPLMCVQALLECLGALASVETSEPPRTSQLATTIPSEPQQQRRDEQSLMDDQIPHFDATQRRREKMRQASVGVKGAPAKSPMPLGTPGRQTTASPAGPTSASAPPLPSEPTRWAPAATTDDTKHDGNGSAIPTPSVPITIEVAAAPAEQTSPPSSAVQPPLPEAPPVAGPEPAPAAGDQDWASFLINFVVEQTGYPPEVVDLDADLEADLGIDSIKKAQLFGELQEYFDVGAMETSELSLDDFPTLRHVLDFLQGSPTSASPTTPGATTPTQPAPVAVPVVEAQPTVESAAPSSASVPVTTTVNASEMESFLVNFVVEQTGYPPEVVELDADLEADLGIDSIKKAQLFGELQEYFDVGSLSSSSELSLDDFPTLRHVLNFLLSHSAPTTGAPAESAPAAPAVEPQTAALQPPPTSVAASPPAAESPPPISTEPAADTAPSVDAGQMESFLINFVVEQTGYPPEVVELDADLEADLGIDSIKKAQLFGELQEYFDVGSLSTTSDLSLDDFPTLRHVLNFLVGAAPQATADSSSNVLGADPDSSSFPSAEPAPAMEENPVELAPAAASSDVAELESFLINFVVEQTGYPAEVVELDADLEADLGIDSIKKAQLFGELQEYFDVGALSTTSELSLDDFPTLRHVLDFLAGHQPVGQAATAAPSTSAAAELDDTQRQGGDASLSTAAELVQLAGTPYDMGWQQGQRFKLEVRSHLRRYVECTSDELDELPGWDPALAGPEKVLSGDELDELQGMADAVQVPLGNMIAHHFAASADLGSGAGKLLARAADNPSGQMIHAIRQPLPTMEALRASVMPTVTMRVPLMGIPYVAVSYVGSVSILGGLNAAGVAVTVSPDVAAGQGQSHAASSIARLLLQRATDLETALSLARSQAEGKPWAAFISDANSDRVAVAQFDGQAFHVRSDEARVAVGDVRWAAGGHEGVTAASLLESPDASHAKRADVEVDHVTIVIDAKAGDVWLHDDREALPQRINASAALPAQYPSAVEAIAPRDDQQLILPAEPVASRFIMQMHEAPLAPELPTVPKWHGGAVIVGDHATSQALASQLTAAGVRVCTIPASQDIDGALSTLERFCQTQTAPHLFIATARDDLPIQPALEAVWTRQRHETMTLPFFVCQKWIELSTTANWLDRASLVAVVANGGDFGFERGSQAAQAGAISGLLKAIFIEYTVMQGKNLRVKTVDTAADTPARVVVEHVFRELASGNLDYEVAYGQDGVRRVPMAVEQPAPIHQARIRSGANWVVTGGSRGITAACALALGKRYGLRLHLLGTSPRPEIDPSWRNLTADGLQQLKASTMIAARKAGQSAAQAWEKLQRDLEIDRTLNAFETAGIDATYYACDVADRAALCQTLQQIREAAGPIEGILHGAGIDHSCRFERKQPDVVSRTIAAKVDGAAHLMALTKTDPVRHFLGFGSISGRLGSFGQTDYCLASDMLCKLIGAYRRERPWIQATGFHWHPWDGVGMAARPETKNVLQGQSQLHLMPLDEGITHLLRELEAGLPEPELLITERRHWDRFAAGLGQLAKGQPETVATEAVPTNVAPLEEDSGSVDPELLTHRCVLRMVSAPLPADASTACSFPASVWILGDNDLASSLRQTLAQAGVDVWQIPTTAGVDATTALMEQQWNERPASHLFLLTGRDSLSQGLVDDRQILEREHVGVILPFFVAQQWYKLLPTRPELGVSNLVAVVSLGGDFGFSGAAATPDGGSMCGLLKAVHIEDSRREQRTVRCKVIDSPVGDSPEIIINAVLRELAANEPEVEVGWSDGQRSVVRPLPAALPSRKPEDKDPQGGTWVVTGGARGITAIAARALAQKYGWKLHLLGVSPAPQEDAAWRNYSDAEMKSLKTQLAREAVAQGRSPSEAWDRVMKDVEIFSNLQQFSAAGISTTYHQCDISDRESVACCLEAVRRQDGPIRGVLHGAGLIDPGRFESKRPGFVGKLIAAKYRGLLNLVSLMREDPLEYCIGFGSISGRFGGNGLTDYAAGNDVMSKVIDWIRTARPGCAATCVHWESWEGSGMATLPRFAWGPKAVMNMKYMAPEEGVRRMQQELEAGLPESEVLYTFGDFYPMFFPDEQRPLGPFQPSAATTDTSSAPSLIGAVRTADDRHLADFPLDPTKDPFLMQHRLRDKPLLPVVVGLEALAEVAAAADGTRRVVGFQDVQMIDGLMFHTDKPLTAQVQASALDEHSCECRLVCDFRNRSGGLIQKDRPYLRAIVRLASEVQHAQAAMTVARPETWTEFSYPEDADVYHGPAFRGVTAFSFDRQAGWGRIAALPVRDLVGDARAEGWLVPSCVLDAAFYACGIHLWMHGDQAISLPRQIDQLDLGRQPQPGQICLVHFVCREIGEKSATYDFTVVDPDGDIVVAAQGYQKVILARGGGPR